MTTTSTTAPIAVVVVTWNSSAVLPGFLAALPEAMAGTEWRLVVADNDSADDTVDVIKRLAPDATVVQTGCNAGYAAGINAALRGAAELPGGFGHVLISNPDIRMRPGCARALADALGDRLADGSRIGIAAPQIRDEDGGLTFSLHRESTVRRALGEAVIGNRRAGRFPTLSEMVTDPAVYATRTKADWSSGALMLLSRECLADCGAWSEAFFLYSEETEYCLRARDRGWATVLIPEAVASHLGGESKVSPRLWTLLTLNRVRLYRMRHGAVATAAFHTAVLLRESLRAALGREQNRASARALLSPRRLNEKPGP